MCTTSAMGTHITIADTRVCTRVHTQPLGPYVQPVTLTDIGIAGEGLAGVHYLRNERDAAALVSAIQGVKDQNGEVRV